LGGTRPEPHLRMQRPLGPPVALAKLTAVPAAHAAKM
jgi:hypothetical protein